MEGIFVIKNMSVKLFCFFNGGYNRDQERVRSTSSDSSMEGLLLSKDFSVKLVSFFNGGSNWSASSMEGVLVIKNMPFKPFFYFNGGYDRDQEHVCQTLQLLQWREYSWSRTWMPNLSASSMEGVSVIKNVSVKPFSFSNGRCIGDQERVCQTLQHLPWRVYWWSRTCLSKSSASLMDGIFVIKNVSVKLSSFINGWYIRDQDRVCQALHLLQWRVYSWSRTCLSNSSTSLM